MDISKKEVEYVANLGRLNLLENELDTYTGQLNSILNFVEKLNEIDTSNVKPTSHALDITNAFREDKVHESISNEKALLNAPDSIDGQFKVPAVIE